MATIVVDVSEDLGRWAEQEAANAGHRGVDDLVRDLLDRERERRRKIANMQRLVDEGRASGISTRTVEEIFEDAKRRAIEAGARL